MITSPSSSRIVEVVRHELRTSIAAAVGDGSTKTVLAMLDTLLHSVSVRCEHEAAWMIEEIAAIESFANIVIDADADREGKVTKAHAELCNARHTSYRLTDIQNEYDHAGKLFSWCLEASLRRGGELREQAETLLRSRVNREIEILGPLSLVGRT